MSDHRIGYARCSTRGQDLAAQEAYLLAAGVPKSNIHTDHGLSGASRDRPGLEKALAVLRAVRSSAAAGDTVTLVVPKIDRLGRSILDLKAIADEITAAGARLEFAGQVYDPTDAMSKFFFGSLALFAEFERDLISQRTREGLAVAKEAGKLRGKTPKLSEMQQKAVVEAYETGQVSMADLAKGWTVGVATIHRIIAAHRAGTHNTTSKEHS